MNPWTGRRNPSEVYWGCLFYAVAGNRYSMAVRDAGKTGASSELNAERNRVELMNTRT